MSPSLSPAFSPLLALAGGAVIGLAASLLLVGIGRVAGISGILAGALLPGDEVGARPVRRAFVGGLVIAGVLLALVAPSVFGAGHDAAVDPRIAIAAGLLVGIGTRVGGGCTSGHGVCGLSRGSARSLVAVAVFMVTAAITVFLVRSVGGGA